MRYIPRLRFVKCGFKQYFIACRMRRNFKWRQNREKLVWWNKREFEALKVPSTCLLLRHMLSIASCVHQQFVISCDHHPYCEQLKEMHSEANNIPYHGPWFIVTQKASKNFVSVLL